MIKREDTRFEVFLDDAIRRGQAAIKAGELKVNELESYVCGYCFGFPTGRVKVALRKKLAIRCSALEILANAAAHDALECRAAAGMLIEATEALHNDKSLI